jgi:signal transduction histidine kinase
MRIRNILLIVGALSFLTNPVTSQDLDSLRAMRDTSLISEAQIELQLEIAYALSAKDICKAVEYAKQALKEAEDIASLRWSAEAKLAIGRFYDFLGVNEEATEYLVESYTSFVELEDSLKQAATLIHIGNAYFYLDQFDQALKKFTLVSEYGRALKDTSIIISGLNATAAVYGNTGKMDSALILFKEAHALSRDFGSLPQEILAYYNIGDVYLYSGRRTQALEVFEDLEKYYKLEVNSPKYLSSLYNSMTKAYQEKGNIEMARHYSNKVLEALNENMRLTEYQEYFLHQYKIDSMENNPEKALANYIRYKNLSDSLNTSSFKERMANLEIYFDMKTKESQIERLTLDNQYKDLKIRQKRLVNYGYVALSILMLTIVFLVIRSYKKIKEKNKLLEKQQEKLKAAQQQLVQSEKMVSIGTLTAGIAHEINNPLNFISGGLGIVNELQDKVDWTGNEKEKEKCNTAVKMAYDGLERSVAIVKALMTFSHKGGSKLVESDLHEIIDNTLMFLKSRISTEIQIIKQYDLEARVPLFPEKMHQIIMNLLDNAIYAVNQESTRPKIIRIATGKKASGFFMTVSNSGPPIAKEHLKQLFDPFFTTKDPGQGTGLGLSICYTLIEEHRGKIKVENTPDGVRFQLTIPLPKKKN